jgi:hypothetical protein
MKIVILLSLVFTFAVCNQEMSQMTKPKPDQAYRSADVFDSNNKSDDFFPFLDEFVTYAGWYRKADKAKSEEENLKDQIDNLKEKLFGKEKVDLKKMAENKELYDEQWLVKQLKISRIMELEDLLSKEASTKKKF